MTRLKAWISNLTKGERSQDEIITYLLGALGFILVIYGATQGMIGWSLPTYAAY